MRSYVSSLSLLRGDLAPKLTVRPFLGLRPGLLQIGVRYSVELAITPPIQSFAFGLFCIAILRTTARLGSFGWPGTGLTHLELREMTECNVEG